MSEKDRFDWNDDVEFEAGSEQVEDIDCFESSLEGFEDFEDTSDYGSDETAADDTPAADAWDEMDREEHAAAAEETADPEEEAPPKAGPAVPNRVTVKRRSGMSAVGMGFLFAASILVAGIGVGGAVLFAEGVDPGSLWQPQNLMKVDQLLNFSEHPLNIIYMVSLGITFLALLGSYRMGKIAVESNARTRAAEEMLDRVCALRLDEQEAWRDESFKAFPPAEEFVIKTLGTWRLQEARQKRLLGVEGEIHRLEKALAEGERTDLTGRYDSPAVGRLVDEMLRHFDAREAAEAKAAETEKRDQDSGQDILSDVGRTLEWNWSARRRVEEPGHEASRLHATLTELSRQGGGAEPDTDGLKDVIAGARKDLASVEKTMAAGGPGRAETNELSELVDRGSKLAFQIAMEVTRLGPRGDRLTPMSQALEDLTTGFRKAVDALPFGEEGGTGAGSTASLAAKLDTLEELVGSLGRDDDSDSAGALEQVAPVAAKIAEDLDSLADDFTTQGDRLGSLGRSLADLTGLSFEAPAAPERAAALDEIEPLDLHRTSPATRPAVLDEGLVTSDFELERPTGFTMDSGPDTHEPLSEPAQEVYDQEVYDLDTFGAEPVADAVSDDEAEDEVFDLDTFGAAPLDTSAPDAGEEETVYDLDQFGADPVSEPEGQDAEPVYEMADLGGSPMTEAADDDEVFDLGSMGAVPLDAPSAAEDDEVLDLNDFGALPLD